MEKVSKRYSRLLQSKKDAKASTKEKKSHGKTENEDFFAGFKKKQQWGPLNSRGIQKVTTSKLTVRTKTLGNAVRSVFTRKDQRCNYEEESKALLNEDLFKIIDLSNPKKDSAILTPSNSGESSNKSLFHEIEEKFNELPLENEPYLITDENLQQLVSKKLLAHKHLILNPWAKTFEDFLYRVRADDLPDILLGRVISNQSKINETCTLFELNTKFRGVKLAGTCLRRKFTRRCNELANLQNFGGKIIMTSQADDIINRTNLEPVLEEQVSVNSNRELPRAVTPEKEPQIFPIVSYTTPKSNRPTFNYISTTCVKYRPAVKSKTRNDYIELDRQRCTDATFVQSYGLSQAEQKFFLSEAVKIEEIAALDLDAIFEQPHKPQTEKKRLLFDTSTPESDHKEASPPMLTPNRRLNFSETYNDDENLDCCLLEDVGKLNISPLQFGGLFTENGARKNDRVTPKRGLEAMLSSGELELRRQNDNGDEDDDESISARAKRFAAAPDSLGPIPTARDTPHFKFGPKF